MKEAGQDIYRENINNTRCIFHLLTRSKTAPAYTSSHFVPPLKTRAVHNEDSDGRQYVVPEVTWGEEGGGFQPRFGFHGYRVKSIDVYCSRLIRSFVT